MLSSKMMSGLYASAARNSSRFVTSISIHLARPLAACAASSACGNASSQANMIFLDQDGFAEVLAMIVAAAHADRIFFERAKARRSFAGIQQFGRPSRQPPAQTVA